MLRQVLIFTQDNECSHSNIQSGSSRAADDNAGLKGEPGTTKDSYESISEIWLRQMVIKQSSEIRGDLFFILHSIAVSNVG